MQQPELSGTEGFRTSTYSGGGNCVEVGRTADGSVMVRDTKDANRALSLVFTKDEWAAFVLGVKHGEFEP